MIQRAYSKRRNIFSRKSTKIQEESWEFIISKPIVTPSPLLAEWNRTKTPLQTDSINSIGLYLPQSPQREAIFPGEAICQHFASCHQLPVAKAKFCASAAKWWLLPSSVHHPTNGMEVLPCVCTTENNDRPISFVSVCKAEIPYWERQAKKTRHYCHQHLLSTQLLKWGVSFREKNGIVPISSFKGLIQRFCLGGEASLKAVPNIFSKERNSFAKKYWEFQTRSSPQNSGGCDEWQLGWYW